METYLIVFHNLGIVCCKEVEQLKILKALSLGESNKKNQAISTIKETRSLIVPLEFNIVLIS